MQMRTIKAVGINLVRSKEEKMSTNNLASERKRLNMTQKEAAAKLGVSVRTLGKYEQDPLIMPGDFILRAARYFGCSANYLLGMTTERSNVQVA